MSTKNIPVGVLDIQGSVEEHFAVLQKMGANVRLVKTKKDLAKISGLIIPGGESTTIGKLMKKSGLDRVIRERAGRVKRNLVVWGTCAGAILLAKKIRNRHPDSLELMDLDIVRNGYGRQIDSFETDLAVSMLQKNIPAIFIRAPRIKKASGKAKVLAQYRGEPVMLQQENLLVTTFHPELTNDTTVHQYFLNLTQHYAESKN